MIGWWFLTALLTVSWKSGGVFTLNLFFHIKGDRLKKWASGNGNVQNSVNREAQKGMRTLKMILVIIGFFVLC
jgi:hypothetical protein